MDQRVVDAVRGHEGIDDWTIRFQHGRGAQVYLAGTAVENVRQVGRDAYEVELFNDHQVDGQPMRGSAVIPLVREDLDRLPEILDDGVAMASLVHNPPWSLPEQLDHPDVPLADERLLDVADAVREARQAAEQIRELVAGAGSGVRLSAAELFLTAVEEELLNSRGLRVSSTSTRVLSELNLLADGDQESEFFRQDEVRRLEDHVRARGIDPESIEPRIEWSRTLAVDLYKRPKYESNESRRRATVEFFKRLGRK